jgi:hypothetical protein
MNKFAMMNKTKISQKILLLVLFTSFCVIGYSQTDDCLSKMETRILQVARAKSNDDLIKRTAEAKILLSKLETCPCFERKSHSLEKEKKRLEKIFNENFCGYATNYVLASGTYTGSFVNGQKNGKGKMNYNESEDYYKYYYGEWKNGKMHGKGILEDWDGTIYDGEFKDGFKEGNGIEKKKNGEYYQGNWSMDFHEGYGKAKIIDIDSSFYEGGVDKAMRKHGWGVKVWKDDNEKIKYEGEFYKDLALGWATVTWGKGSIYKGKWNQFGPEEFGELNANSCIKCISISNCPNAMYYSGHYEKFLKEGFGRCYDKNHRLIYEGQFKNDKPFGTYPNVFPIANNTNVVVKEYSEGEKYVGQVTQNLRNGYGTLTFKNKDKYVGQWKDNSRYGWGEYIANDGSKYIGEYENNKKQGWGTYTEKRGTIIQGQWKENNLNGFASISMPDGYFFKNCTEAKYYYGNIKYDIITGIYIEGFGRMYDKDHRLLYEGEFKDSRPFGDKFPNR